ncbi:MAG: cytochrome c/FTR1 family iron permease [Burkholderiales bacterium]|nr:cytochrome c/FTR1 family iron permease [Burkholderiales bacterium]
MLARLLLAVLLATSLCARADNSAQTIVHMLDYVSVDYPEFVQNGTVLDEAEYKEQLEFAAQSAVLLAKLPAVPEQAALLVQAEQLKQRILAKAPGPEITALASALRWKMIDAYKLTVAPKTSPDLKRGAALYVAHCTACHGSEGRGDGIAGKGMEPAPSNFHDGARMAQRSVYGLYSTITLGVDGTGMATFSALSEDERWALALYVATMGQAAERISKGGALWQARTGNKEIGTLRAVATLTDNDVTEKYGPDVAAAFAWLKANPQALAVIKEEPIAYSRRLLGESLAAYRAGKRDEAQQLALTSYLEGFELVEASLDTLDRNLRQEVETQMIAYRDLLRRGAPAEPVTQLAERIDGLLAASADRLGNTGLSPTTAAISAFFILVREGLEALLVVAAIIALLVKSGRREALPWIHAGWIGALVMGVATWFIASTLIAISGATRELTEGITALLAAAILIYVGFWLHGKSYAHAWKAFIDQHLSAALQGGTLWALAGVSFLAVYREAFETVLFYQALWQQVGAGAHGYIVIGFLCGVAVLVALAWVILRYGVRLPIGPFFATCSVLMAALAVIFTGHGIKALQEAGMIAAVPFGGFNLSALGIYATAESMLAQLFVLLTVIAAFFWAHHSNSRRETAH